MRVLANVSCLNYLIKHLLKFSEKSIKKKAFLTMKQCHTSIFGKKWIILIFLAILPPLLVSGTVPEENKLCTTLDDLTPRRYMVFLPNGMDYPWPDQILHRYKLLPALLVLSTPVDLAEWSNSNQGVIVQPDNNYQQSLASQSVDMFSSQNVSAIDFVGVQSIHEAGINGSDVRIGIIDTGIYGDHIEIAGKVVSEKSFVLKKFGYSQDIIDPSPNNPHGTKVAGIAAGKTIGIAPGAELVSVKIFHDEIRGNANEDSEETTSALLAAIEYAVEEGCDVINLSIGQYHNLVDDGRAAIVDYFSKNYGVIFCVAAGNEGRLPFCSGTVSNPGSAFQAITVAACGIEVGLMAPFSGTGPRPDYTMKPDIVAPGVFVCAPNDNSDGYCGFSGTSAASPVVAGAAALMIQYLREKNLDYDPGTVKAALLNGAEKMTYKNTTIPPDYQGAGLLNVENAWNCLISANTTGNNVNLLASLPESLPFRPFTTLFTGESVAFNATVVSSKKVTATVSLAGIPLDFVTFPDTIELADSTRLPVSFTIPESAEPGHYAGNLTVIYGSKTSTVFSLEFYLKRPEKRVLFDEKHTVLTYRPHTGTGSWGDNNFLSGMFREYATTLIERNISITPFREGLLTSNLLERYDALVLANPCSWIVDRYTDWLSSDQLTCNQSIYDITEYDAIENFVKKKGGGLLIFTLGSETVSVETLNDLLNRFGIDLSSEASSGYGLARNHYTNLPFLEGVSSYTHYGSTFSIIASSGAFEVAYLDEQLVAAGNYYPDSNGRIIVFGTDYPFTNMGMNELFHSDSNNKLLSIQVTGWTCNDSSFAHPVTAAKKGFITSLPPFMLNSLIFMTSHIFIAITVLIRYKEKETKDRRWLFP
ncbi:MAG: S8 family serine peptidase [Candidatus Hodarchaeales archaeon]